MIDYKSKVLAVYPKAYAKPLPGGWCILVPLGMIDNRDTFKAIALHSGSELEAWVHAYSGLKEKP